MEGLDTLVTAIWVLIFLIGLFVFMVGAVIGAEFIRRERTETKDDDWLERKK